MKLPLHCRTIPADKPFLASLARWVLDTHGKDSINLARTLILLPNRRACRSLREAFLDIGGGKPLLLPRMQPIGELEEEALYFETDTTIPPAIALMRRELLLAQLVMGFDENFNTEQAAKLARELARLIDEVAREGLSFDRLSKLVPEELAGHWQETLSFLSLVSQNWPNVLKDEEAIDPPTRRNRLLESTIAGWKKAPPDYPIIAAGSTGSIPITAKLLSTIVRLPHGMVVLPGLDKAMPENEWEMVTETHPQFGLKQLLERMECKRTEVEWLTEASSHTARMQCFNAALTPPEATSRWMQSNIPLAQGLENVGTLTADTLQDEARLIAIALREALETPGKTAALITPDRALAHMVGAQMQRFAIAIDDSAGQPLADTPPACFLRLIAEMMASQAAPSELLAVLRHPLAAAGMDPAECRLLSRKLETGLLRGLRRIPGLQSLASAAKHENTVELFPLLAALAKNAAPLAQCFTGKPVPLRALLSTHMAFAEWLASSNAAPGTARLWEGEAGNQLASFLAELLQHADALPPVDAHAYPGLFETLLAGQVYRPRYGLHPRLHILSPIEARMQHFDLVILGSLNEGTWPADAQADPWMSRPMRHAFGLPSAERSIGQSAHDLMLLVNAPQVILSRARKVEGTPTVPSRWLVRLMTLVQGLNASIAERLDRTPYYTAASQWLDAPLNIDKLERPQPKPPLEVRPRQLRVTAIDHWRRDPYTIYARYILNLKLLEPLDEDPDAADFGMLVHNALERFITAWPQALPENALVELLECGRAAFASMMDRPAIACLWWPRFEGMAAWILQQERARRQHITQIYAETEGKWTFNPGTNPFTLTTRIDRLEIGRDGNASLVDYKTGTLPTQSDIDRGFANQLPLEALIAKHGTLKNGAENPAAIQRMEYWKLAGNPDNCETKEIHEGEMEAARERLFALVARFDNAATAYTAASSALSPRYNDYEQLTRRAEWEEV